MSLRMCSLPLSHHHTFNYATIYFGVETTTFIANLYNIVIFITSSSNWRYSTCSRVERCYSLHCRMFNKNPGLYLADASSIHIQVGTTKDVFRHCKCPSLRTTILKNIPLMCDNICYFPDSAVLPHLRRFISLPEVTVSSHPLRYTPPKWISRFFANLPRL